MYVNCCTYQERSHITRNLCNTEINVSLPRIQKRWVHFKPVVFNFWCSDRCFIKYTESFVHGKVLFNNNDKLHLNIWEVFPEDFIKTNGTLAARHFTKCPSKIVHRFFVRDSYSHVTL